MLGGSSDELIRNNHGDFGEDFVGSDRQSSSKFEVTRSSKRNVTICCAQSSRKLYKNRVKFSTTHKILSSLNESL
jgi:hypothetical protein